jgi:hypothetical protein
MLIQKSFNKMVPVAEGAVFSILGMNTTGFAVFIENQDTANTIVYTFKESSDGVTWVDIAFNEVSDFSIIAGQVHLVKVTSAQPYVKLDAYGDAPVSISISYHKTSDVGVNSVQVFESP